MSYHFDRETWTFNTEGRGIRIPVLLVMLLAPCMGALFLMFLPVIGFYLFIQTVAKWIGARVQGLVHLALTGTPAPGTAHLTGSDDGLNEIQDEISKQRDWYK